ncbi:MAG: hypothetical protein ACK4F9_01470 [Brevinematia bacterium]
MLEGTRMKWWFVILLSVFVSTSFAGVDIRYDLNYFGLPKNSYLNPANFLRLETKIEPRISFFWQDKIKFFDEKIGVKFSDLMKVSPSIDETVLTNRINELYLLFMPIDSFMFVFGKEVVSSGVGYFKNLTDYFVGKRLNEDDRADFKKYTEGKILVDIQFFMENYSFQFVFAPKISWDERWIEQYLSLPQDKNELLLRIQGNIYGLDISPLLYYDGALNLGLNVSYVIGESLELHFEGNYASKITKKFIDVDDVYYMGNKIGETNILFEEEFNWIPAFIIGGHYTFKEQKITIMFEYFYNGYGLEKERWEKSLDLIEETSRNFSPTNVFSLASLQTEKQFLDSYGFTYLVNHYLMGRISKKFDNLLSWEAVCVNNLVDFSGYVGNKIYFNFENGVVVTELSFPFGREKSEFGLITYSFQVRLNFLLFID